MINISKNGKIKHYLLVGFCLTLLNSCNIENRQIVNFKNIDVVNRNIKNDISKDNTLIELNKQPGDGLVKLTDLKFETGIINLDVKGEFSEERLSFVGIAFNIENDSTFESIYFRPTNFNSDDENRRKHMVQYMCKPTYPWYELRENNEGEFESQIVNPPNPNDWFNSKIIITNDSLKVFVNEQKNPVLSVKRLCEYRSGEIALWVGHGSSGSFRNLYIDNN